MTSINSPSLENKIQVLKIVVEAIKKSECKNHCKKKVGKNIEAVVRRCEFCEIFKNTFFYRTPPVAASEIASVASQWAFTYSKLTTETLEQGVKYVQS